MNSKISHSPWKKYRFPRKLKKKLKKSNRYNNCSRLMIMVNFGRLYSYKCSNFY